MQSSICNLRTQVLTPKESLQDVEGYGRDIICAHMRSHKHVCTYVKVLIHSSFCV